MQSSRIPDFCEVSLETVAGARPDLVLLPDEPYAFAERHVPELRETGVNAPCRFVDGKDLSWYGARIPAALDRLRLLATDAAASWQSTG